MKADLLNLDCDESLVWAAQKIYHKCRERVTAKVQYVQPDVGARIIIEMAMRIERWMEFIAAGGRCGLDPEGQGLCRVPLELHATQILISHGQFPRNTLRRIDGTHVDTNAEGTLNREELGRIFNSHCRLERLGFLKSQTNNIGAESPEQVARLIRELETEVSAYAFFSTSHRRDWHGMSIARALEAAIAVKPEFLDSYGVGKLFHALPDVMSFYQKQLHASSVPGSLMYVASSDPEETRKLLGDGREPANGAARLAGLIGMGSLLLVFEAIDELPLGLALVNQHIGELE